MIQITDSILILYPTAWPTMKNKGLIPRLKRKYLLAIIWPTVAHSVVRSRESKNFANNLDQQETRNENISPDTRQTLANGSNIYLVEKHRHRIDKLEFLIKWLSYLNHPNTWKPEDHSPTALVEKYFQQSLRENSTPTNVVLRTSNVYRPCQLLLNRKLCCMLILTLIAVIMLTAVASTFTVTSSLSLESRTSPLFHLKVTLLGKKYWPTAPQPA